MAKIHSLNIGGSTYVIEPKTVKINDVRGEDRLTSYFADYALTPWFNQNSGVNEEHWASGITMKGWSNDYQSWQLAAGSSDFLQSGLKFRNGLNDTWEPWKSVILEGDTATSAYSIYVTYNPLSNATYSVPFMDAGHSQNSKIYSDDTFNYNPYTNTLTATYFDGTAFKVYTTPRIGGISYLAFLNDKTPGGRYAYSYSHAFMNTFTGEMQIPNLRLKHTNNNFSSYLRFGDGNYSYICETPDNRLIYSARRHTLRTSGEEGIHLDGFTYLNNSVEPKRNNIFNLGSSSNKFKAAYSTTFYGNLIGNVIGDFVGDVTMNAESASQVNVTATETIGNYPLILGPAANAGATIDTGNKSLYTDSENNLYYNPSTNTLTATNFDGIAKKVNVTNKTSGITYLAFFDDKTTGGCYAYSYSHAFMNTTNGEMQIPNLRLKHTDNNFSSYLRFGDSNYSYICETPDNRLIYSARQHTIQTFRNDGIHLDCFTYIGKGVEPKRDNIFNLGSSSNKFKAAYSTNFFGDLTGDVTGNLTGTATNANKVKVNPTSIDENYPLIFGPSIFPGGPVDMGNKSLYTDSVNNLYYNPNTSTLTSSKFEGNVIGDVSGNASSSTTVNVTTKSTAGSFPLIFGPTSRAGQSIETGNKSLYTDSVNNLYYNPSTNTLTATYFNGEASKVKVTVTTTSANYPLILGPSTAEGTSVATGSKSLYTDNYNNLYYNPSNNTLTATKFSGNLTGRLLPKTTNTSAIETTYTGISGIEYHSNVNRYQNGSNYYAGTAYGFPVLSNANAVLNFETHEYNGASYYLHQIGFSSDNRLYHRAFHGNNPNSASSTSSNQNGKTWNSIPLCKPSNYGQVRNIEVVTSMPSTPNAYTLYLVLG